MGTVGSFALGALGLYEVDRGVSWAFVLFVLPCFVLLVSIAFAVRGYSLRETEILVKRLGGSVRLPLRNLQSIEGNADAMQGTLPLFVGGLFSFTGLYWNRRLKLYRAFATDPSRAVVLRYPRSKVVITPHDPQQFIVRARTYLKTLDYPR